MNTRADVVIVGGGWTGLLSAYLLAKEGKRVVVLEADRIGSGATSLTTAFLTFAIDTGFNDLIRLFGLDAARVVQTSGAAAISFIEELTKDGDLPPLFTRCPLYLLAHDAKTAKYLRKEQKAAAKLGFPAKLTTSGIPGIATHGALKIPDQAKFDASKAIGGLRLAVERLGVIIREYSPASAIRPSQSGIEVQTKDGVITATDVITATYLPFNKPRALSFRKAEYTSYVLEAEIPRGLFEEAIFIDTDNPYHYFRIDPDAEHDRIVIGGEDHRSDIPVNLEKHFAALERYLKRLCGDSPYTIVRRWKGPIIETIDRLPYIGAYAPHQYVATGFSGSGMTFAAVAAMIFRDRIMSRENPWVSVYDPLRRPTLRQLAAAGIAFSAELWNGAVRNAFKKD